MSFINRNKKREAFVEDGLCRDCGNKPFIKNRKICQECLEKRQRRRILRTKRNKLKSNCDHCSKPSRPGKILCQSCSDLVRENAKLRRKENKQFIINYFGGKCIECGEMDIRCLSLDHLDKNGKLDRTSDTGKKQLTPAWYAKLVKLIKENLPLPRRLQLLCFNCHAKKDLAPWWIK